MPRVRSIRAPGFDAQSSEAPPLIRSGLPVHQLACDGIAILVVSSDMPEMLTISDGILKMHAGPSRGRNQFDDAPDERIMPLAALEHADPAYPKVTPTGFVP